MIELDYCYTERSHYNEYFWSFSRLTTPPWPANQSPRPGHQTAPMTTLWKPATSPSSPPTALRVRLPWQLHRWSILSPCCLLHSIIFHICFRFLLTHFLRSILDFQFILICLFYLVIYAKKLPQWKDVVMTTGSHFFAAHTIAHTPHISIFLACVIWSSSYRTTELRSKGKHQHGYFTMAVNFYSSAFHNLIIKDHSVL